MGLFDVSKYIGNTSSSNINRTSSTSNPFKTSSTSSSTAPILSLNTDLYSMDDSSTQVDSNTMIQRYNERIQYFENLDAESTDGYKTFTDKIEASKKEAETLQATYTEKSNSLTGLKQQLEARKKEEPVNENAIAQLESQIKEAENELKSVKENLDKANYNAYFYTKCSERYIQNVDIWKSAQIENLKAELEDYKKNLSQNSETSNLEVNTSEAVSEKDLRATFLEYKNLKAEYDSNPTTINKVKLAAIAKLFEYQYQNCNNTNSSIKSASDIISKWLTDNL